MLWFANVSGLELAKAPVFKRGGTGTCPRKKEHRGRDNNKLDLSVCVCVMTICCGCVCMCCVCKCICCVYMYVYTYMYVYAPACVSYKRKEKRGTVTLSSAETAAPSLTLHHWMLLSYGWKLAGHGLLQLSLGVNHNVTILPGPESNQS